MLSFSDQIVTRVLLFALLCFVSAPIFAFFYYFSIEVCYVLRNYSQNIKS